MRTRTTDGRVTARRSAPEIRELLLAATRRLLVAVPAHDLTVRAIGEEAGLQPSLINRYFEGRDALVTAAAASILTEFAAAIEAADPAEAAHVAAGYLVDNPIDLAALSSAFRVGSNPSYPVQVPALEALHLKLQQADPPGPDRAQVALAMSFIVGWVTMRGRFQPFAGVAAAELDAEFHAALDQMLQPRRPAAPAPS
ncbi:MAG: TetR family transcriptional regulator [Actinobacteria bacterium]|nr:TetR family transcriptional regulator [Actinomycetota bacterium]